MHGKVCGKQSFFTLFTFFTLFSCFKDNIYKDLDVSCVYVRMKNAYKWKAALSLTVLYNKYTTVNNSYTPR